MNLNKLFKNLMGTWAFHRSLDSQKKEAILGIVIGTALITKVDETTLHYQEQGIFTTNHGAIINITREYIYNYCPVEQKIEKFFSIGGSQSKLFYRVHFRAINTETVLKADAFHLCNKDRYEAEYVFFEGELFDRFSLNYHIIGPTKDYTSETMFKRLSDIS